MAGSLTARTLARPSFESAFEPPAFIAAMLAFESALAQAQAAEGLIPAASAQAIAAACDRIRIDADALVEEGKRSATLAVPLVKMLRSEVARASADSAKHVHFGATSQDVLDTAMALCLKTCLEEADRALEAAVRSLAGRARKHRATPMLGRTLMQPAMPITAGLKIARWAHALAQDRERIADAQAVGLAVQLGGPVGALEALGRRGPAVRHRLAMHLGLADARAWHAHRNAWIDLLGRMAQATLTAGKIARDVALMAQPEVGEMLEAAPREGVGMSSAMPHKRNPVACVHALAAATRMPGLLASLHAAGVGEHERALGGWQAELALVPDIAGALGTALEFLDTIAASLVVNAQRMKANLEAYGEARRDTRAAETAVDELLADLAPYLS
jgi:3-carboxy-cis,cis-muconate cycloisomerase